LSDVQCHFPNAHLIKEGLSRFKGIQIKVSQYKTTCTVSQNGQIVLVGSESITDAREAAWFMFTVLDGQGDDEFTITNIASSVAWNHPLSLAKLYNNLRGSIHRPSDMVYEPELGTNCIDLRCEHGMAKIFSTGNMVITGCKREADIIGTLRLTLCLINENFNKNV